MEPIKTASKKQDLGFAENICEIRRITGLTQAKFGEMYGIPKRTIENWEGGKRECPAYVINLLKRAVLEDFC